MVEISSDHDGGVLRLIKGLLKGVINDRNVKIRVIILKWEDGRLH